METGHPSDRRDRGAEAGYTDYGEAFPQHALHAFRTFGTRRCSPSVRSMIFIGLPTRNGKVAGRPIYFVRHSEAYERMVPDWDKGYVLQTGDRDKRPIST